MVKTFYLIKGNVYEVEKNFQRLRKDEILFMESVYS